jgi:hypothetical protein
MRRLLTVAILGLGAVLLLAGVSSGGSTFQFTSINFPGAVLTRAEGINPGGEVVGDYVDASGKRHGFLKSGGNFISINYPGALSTTATGINPGGDIVGDWNDGKGNGLASIHGFLLSGGAFSEIQFPGYLGTIAQRISPNGDIYGCNHNTDFMASMHGFVRNSEGYTAIQVPASMNNGATPDGSTIIGLYTDLVTGLTHGYVIENGNFSPFDVPGSILTQAWDINPAGDIVGNFLDGAGKMHGFLRTVAGFTTIDFPSAVATQARGINPAGSIVGYYVDSTGKTHGFLRNVQD